MDFKHVPASEISFECSLAFHQQGERHKHGIQQTLCKLDVKAQSTRSLYRGPHFANPLFSFDDAPIHYGEPGFQVERRPGRELEIELLSVGLDASIRLPFHQI